ncbi:MAG: hypothetical protein GY854_18165 [Deltaproteobacteria bacterium]|nr:hypothetical protein [Deltaproteobacteria bacterium]
MDGKTRIATRAAGGTAPKKRRVLWGAFLAFLVPLPVLLRLQYSWLTDLEETSAIARQAELDSYLLRISKEVRFYYVNLAHKALTLDARLL